MPNEFTDKRCDELRAALIQALTPLQQYRTEIGKISYCQDVAMVTITVKLIPEDTGI